VIAIAPLSARGNTKEANMPLVLLWVGIPVLLVGGGYFVIHAMH
jgi:hypothetical protein